MNSLRHLVRNSINYSVRNDFYGYERKSNISEKMDFDLCPMVPIALQMESRMYTMDEHKNSGVHTYIFFKITIPNRFKLSICKSNSSSLNYSFPARIDGIVSTSSSGSLHSISLLFSLSLSLFFLPSSFIFVTTALLDS